PPTGTLAKPGPRAALLVLATGLVRGKQDAFAVLQSALLRNRDREIVVTGHRDSDEAFARDGRRVPPPVAANRRCAFERCECRVRSPVAVGDKLTSVRFAAADAVDESAALASSFSERVDHHVGWGRTAVVGFQETRADAGHLLVGIRWLVFGRVA